MLTIVVPEQHLFDDSTQKFVNNEAVTLELEHSLVSLSKWESTWEIPFMAEEPEKTDAQTLDYVRCMVLTPDVPPEVFNRVSAENLADVNKYINAKMTATWFTDQPIPGVKPVVTAEIVYYWMVSLQIPFECQDWHFNRLMTLIKVINEKNAPEKKQTRSHRDIAAERRAMNRARRDKMGSAG